MKTTRARRLRRAVLVAVPAVGVAAAVLVAGASRAVASPASAGANPSIHGIETFNVLRGGEYFFVPSCPRRAGSRTSATERARR
jgi:hypothetical protein